MFCSKLVWIGCGVFAAFGCADADSLLDEPLALSNRQPLVQIFNLPAARSGAVLATGQGAGRVGVDIANNFTHSQRGSEAIFLDGESRRVELGARLGIGDDWEIGAMLPWLDYSGGTLDSTIEHWHSFWGLPDGGRPNYARNQLSFQYRRDGVTALDFQRAESGIGDAQLTAAYSLARTPRSAIALAAALNLPTGAANKLTGADATNFSLLLAATRYDVFGWPLTATGNVGAMFLNRGEVLGDRQKDTVWFGAAELGWAVADGWRLEAQLQAHTAFYRSELRELGADSAQLLFGGSVQLARQWLLDVAVGEDIAVNTAPDVTFQLALKTAF